MTPAQQITLILNATRATDAEFARQANTTRRRVQSWRAMAAADAAGRPYAGRERLRAPTADDVETVRAVARRMLAESVEVVG